jgi:hypothetical protein
MIYRGPGFLAVIWFGSSSTPSPHTRQQVVFLSQSYYVLPTEGGGVGAKSYDGEKA